MCVECDECASAMISIKKTVEDSIDHSPENGACACHSYLEADIPCWAESSCESRSGEHDASAGTNSSCEGSDSLEASSASTSDVDKEGPSCLECSST